MARPRTNAPQKDILSRVGKLGGEALHKLTDIPGGSRVLELANESKSRIDEMQKKLRGLDALEKRVARLEKQLASRPKPAAKKPATGTGTTGGTAAPRATPAAKRPAPKKPKP